MQTALRIVLAAAAMVASAGLAEAATAKKPTQQTVSKPAKKAVTAKLAKDIPLPTPRPAIFNAAGRATAAAAASPAPLPVTAKTATLAPAIPLAMATSPATPVADTDTVKRAIELARKGRTSEATNLAKTLPDPAARKLIEWVILRGDDNNADFARYNSFIAANPGWPGIPALRRRAEAMLWQERAGLDTLRTFYTHDTPRTAKGRFALARALLAQGDRSGAQTHAREAWRRESFSRDLETQARDMFSGLITPADDKARMEHRLYAEDTETALRAAHRLGGHQIALAKARIAVIDKTSNARALLEAVPAQARREAGYIFSKAQWLRRQDKIAEAGQLMLTAPHDASHLYDLDEWWIERRLLARKLLDIGDAKTAYLVVSGAATPPKELYRSESHFTAGWIALRFLNDPAAAAGHFARVGQGASHPTTLARAHYWLGRTAEASAKPREARTQYEAAARFSTAYYGQIARAKLGLSDMALRPLPVPSSEQRAALRQNEVVRAVELLYAINERDLAAIALAGLGERMTDQGALFMVGETAARNDDARALLLLGKAALARGLPFDLHAFPTAGLPRYASIGPEVEPALTYSIAKQESGFNPKVVSSASALGLMQVTPAAGRYVAKKFGVAFDQKRLLHDPVYNMQMGAAELGDALERYRGSYILAFAAYNAGSGRVREWIERYGDPRDAKVDPIDWVERIPFSETRNYVQRIVENLQVYRVRFGGGARLLIEADLRRGAAGR